MANNVMTASIEAIIKEKLSIFAAEDPSFANKYPHSDERFQECVNMIYEALYQLAKEQAEGASATAIQGSDDLIVSAACHFYDEEGEVTIESIKEILKGGVVVHPMKKKDSKPTATTKPTAKPVPTANPVPTMGISKPTPKPVPTPTAKPVPKPTPKPTPTPTVEDDEPDLFG